MVDAQHVPVNDHILLVSHDVNMCGPVIRMLVNAGGYRVSLAGSFEDALEYLLRLRFALALIDVKLPDLSGIDLMTATTSLCCGEVAVILMDDELSVKSAIAAFRMGAIDFITKPVNLDFMLMRVDRHIHDMQRARAAARQSAPASSNGKKPSQAVPPSTALVITQEQFTRINHALHDLYQRIDAQFIGLVDATHNLVGAAGGLENNDLMLLTRALGTGKGATSANSLVTILGEAPFYSTYLEGSNNGVYIIDFGEPHHVALIVICPIKAKRGVVWLYSKRAAVAISGILGSPDSQPAPDVARSAP